MKKWLSYGLLPMLAVAVFPAAVSAVTAIRQSDYTFRQEMARVITISTFVIGDFAASKTLRPAAAVPVDERNRRRLAIRMGQQATAGHGKIMKEDLLMPPILFKLASAELSEQTKRKILSVLGKRTSKTTPLLITGYTCDLGPQKVNDELALARAGSVAALLKANGFTVAAIFGKGRQDYIVIDPEMRYLNRRVEISILPRTDQGNR